MKYLDPKFSSRPASKEYRDGWERTFGPKVTVEFDKGRLVVDLTGMPGRSSTTWQPKKPRRRG